MKLTLQELLAMNGKQLHEIVARGAPLDLDALANSRYTGIDLSMPALFHKLFWRTFRKTFYRDPTSGRLRGWNVMVEQTGWQTPPEPRRDSRGQQRTFGHYEVKPAAGQRFPRNWQGGHYLDYAAAGNLFLDWPARTGYCPLVAVNPGDMDLLLGWEIFRFGSLNVPLPDYWLLQREGPLPAEDVVARPVPLQARVLGAG